jgi:hypothetical protein
LRINHDNRVLVAVLVHTQQLSGLLIDMGITEGSHDDVGLRPEIEMPAAQAVVEAFTAEETLEQLLHAAIGDEKYDWALAAVSIGARAHERTPAA